MRILLIDASPLLFKVFTGPVQHFTNTKGEPTGLRFGVIRAVRAYEKKLKPDKVVLVWDMDTHGDSGPRFDNERAYKGNRDYTSEEAKLVWGGIPDVQAMLHLTKYTQAWADCFEADDVIGSLARQLAGQGAEVVIHSVDRDLWQLFSDPKIVGWENTKSGQGKFFGPADVIAEFGVPPKHLLFYRAVIGDPSDNLKGIGLAGDGKALLKQWLMSLSPRGLPLFEYEDLMAAQAPEMHARVFSVKTMRERLVSNFHLMTLHVPDEVTLARGTNQRMELESLFKALEMKSLIPRVGEFVNVVEDPL